MKEEVIELEAIWYGGGFHFCLDQNSSKIEDYKIVNIDTTIICEKPKLSKYKAKIRKSLASILLIPLGCISVKATTSEELGHIGEKLGIACKTVLLLRKNNLDKL